VPDRYDVDVLATYFSRRPLLVMQRNAVVVGRLSGFCLAILADWRLGTWEANMPLRAQWIKEVGSRGKGDLPTAGSDGRRYWLGCPCIPTRIVGWRHSGKQYVQAQCLRWHDCLPDLLSSALLCHSIAMLMSHSCNGPAQTPATDYQPDLARPVQQR
jgi:hypothetical protein